MSSHCGHDLTGVTAFDVHGRRDCTECRKERAARLGGLGGQHAVLGEILQRHGRLPRQQLAQQYLCEALTRRLSPDPADLLVTLHEHEVITADPDDGAVDLAEELAQAMTPPPTV
jgi:hypothetical protein